MACGNCCLESKISLRSQLCILLAVCGVFYLALMPFIFESARTAIGVSFEIEYAGANVNRAMAAMNKLLQHEEEFLYAYSDSDELADAVDNLVEDENTFDDFMDFISSEFFDYGRWSDTCGNLLAIYTKEDNTPSLLWSEYHPYNQETLDVDYENSAPTPSIFLGETAGSISFLRQLVTGESKVGFAALADGMFVLACQPIIHGDTGDEAHGYLCRATDIHLHLESFSSGAGACITAYNMANISSIPNETLEIFHSLKRGERSEDNKFDGEWTTKPVTSLKKWNPPPKPIRMCGPTELLREKASSRTMLYLVMEDEFGAVLSSDKSTTGFGLILDNSRELKSMLDKNLLGSLVFLFIFAIVVFVVYAIFTEYGVLRKLDLIAETAYEVLIENDYEKYYNKPEKSRKDGRDRGKNEFIHMATIAAQTVEKNMKEYDEKKNSLILERMRSSVVADQLRLLALYCGRTESDYEAIMFKRKKDKKRRRIEGRSMFAADITQVLTETISLERVVNDPFAVEMLKNFSIMNPVTQRITFPARRSVLFLLSALFYRSLTNTTAKAARLEVLKNIMDEFVLSAPVPGSPTNRVPDDDIVGIPEEVCEKLTAEANKCIEAEEPSKTLFDGACVAVKDYLKTYIFPKFARTPAFLVIRAAFAQMSKLQEKADAIEMKKNDPYSTYSNRPPRFTARDSDKNQSSNSLLAPPTYVSVKDLENDSEGTKLSRSAFRFITTSLISTLQQ